MVLVNNVTDGGGGVAFPPPWKNGKIVKQGIIPSGPNKGKAFTVTEMPNGNRLEQVAGSRPYLTHVGPAPHPMAPMLDPNGDPIAGKYAFPPAINGGTVYKQGIIHSGPLKGRPFTITEMSDGSRREQVAGYDSYQTRGPIPVDMRIGFRNPDPVPAGSGNAGNSGGGQGNHDGGNGGQNGPGGSGGGQGGGNSGGQGGGGQGGGQNGPGGSGGGQGPGGNSTSANSEITLRQKLENAIKSLGGDRNPRQTIVNEVNALGGFPGGGSSEPVDMKIGFRNPEPPRRPVDIPPTHHPSPVGISGGFNALGGDFHPHPMPPVGAPSDGGGHIPDPTPIGGGSVSAFHYGNGQGGAGTGISGSPTGQPMPPVSPGGGLVEPIDVKVGFKAPTPGLPNVGMHPHPEPIAPGTPGLNGGATLLDKPTGGLPNSQVSIMPDYTHGTNHPGIGGLPKL